jgi:hypothetical protein
MHCLYGVMVKRRKYKEKKKPSKELHAYGCSVVYDLRNYTANNHWGPYQDKLATVDWERMEAIMTILSHNVELYTLSSRYVHSSLETCTCFILCLKVSTYWYKRTNLKSSPRVAQHWITPFKGASPGSYTPMTITDLPQPAPNPEPKDPYNIAGTWMRVSSLI